ncbi:hypothetical protein ACIP5Y_14870 [Nocardia sp. NPDC088792]|uniref:hypothetical protein n=1 Tax=Nocardia sp. NPDC088792 TaxID=3364332 RepID=UPI0038189CBC
MTHQVYDDGDDAAIQDYELLCRTLSFADLGDRLVRLMFDTGPRLDSLRAVFERASATPEELRAAGSAAGRVLGDLDSAIRETGVSMLAITSTAPVEELTRKRRGAYRLDS